MPIPKAHIQSAGHCLTLTGSLLAANTHLRDAGVLYQCMAQSSTQVNAAGDAWIEIPGWMVSDTEPTDTFEGMGWFDTNVDQLKITTMATLNRWRAGYRRTTCTTLPCCKG